MRKATRTAMVGLLALACLALSGCTDGEDDDLPQAPQIIPHVNPVNFCQVQMGRQVSFDLMLWNFGREVLKIDRFEVLHDRRCAFERPNGTVVLYNNEDPVNDPDDEYAATARKLEAAFMKIEYVPPAVGEDAVTIRVYSNAQNPELMGRDYLDVFVCAAGSDTEPLSCRIRLDPGCTDLGIACLDDEDCCDSHGGIDDDEEGCLGPQQCIREAPEDGEGTCICRPCALPPEESWENCGST